MKRLMMVAALALLTTGAYAGAVKDKTEQACARFEGEDKEECLDRGVKGVLKMHREFREQAKQGKLCGDYWGPENCKRKK